VKVDASEQAGTDFLPHVPGAVSALGQGMECHLREGRALIRVVELLGGPGSDVAQAGAAVGMAGGCWRAHTRVDDAHGILAGDALLTRALELGCLLPDEECRSTFSAYVARAFISGGEGSRYLLGAAIELGLALGGRILPLAAGDRTDELRELLRSANGPLMVPRDERGPSPSELEEWVSLLHSPDVAEWR
jgi:hypothetical protein